MKFQTIISLVLLLFAISCTTPPAIIIPTDFDSIYAGIDKDGVTVEEVDSLDLKVGRLLENNTEGKKLPDVKVMDLENRGVNLPDQINAETIILSSDIHCAMAFECLSNEYPKAMKMFGKNHQLPPTICLVIKTEYDDENEGKFNTAVAKLKPYYQKLYIINENEARKINLHYVITRLYLNKEKVVENMEFGAWTAEKLDKEFSQNSL